MNLILEERQMHQQQVLSWIENMLVVDPRKDAVVTMFSDEIFAERFFSFPASTKYHSSFPGGLYSHTSNVLDRAFKLSAAFPELAVNPASLFLVCLVHDIGKIGDLNNPGYIGSSGNKFTFNYSVRLPHHELSLWWCNHFGIKLHVDEHQAISQHNGAYIARYEEVVWKEYPLLILLHHADALAAQIEPRG